ncbi:MAG: hypothetical protein AAF629_23715, partial [Chloroflexota bacterium]
HDGGLLHPPARPLCGPAEMVGSLRPRRHRHALRADAVAGPTGFDGWISLEEASKTGKHGFQAGVDYIRKIWQTNS